jgi:hypothetical protein
MSDSLSPEEIRAAAEVHDELGPRYRDAVIDSFLEKVGNEIDARVAARLGQAQLGQVPFAPSSAAASPGAAPPAAASSSAERRGRHHEHPGSPLALAVCSLVFGIPISAIAVAAGDHPAGLLGLIVVWIAIAAINIAYNISYAARHR